MLKKSQGLLAVECVHYPKSCCGLGCAGACGNSGCGSCSADAGETIEFVSNGAESVTTPVTFSKNHAKPNATPAVVVDVELAENPLREDKAQGEEPEVEDSLAAPAELPFPPRRPLPLPELFPAP